MKTNEWMYQVDTRESSVKSKACFYPNDCVKRPGGLSPPFPIFQTNQPSDRLLQAANHLERGGTWAFKLNILSNNHCLFQANQQKAK